MLSQTHHIAKPKHKPRDFPSGRSKTQEAEYFLLFPPVGGKRRAFSLGDLNFVRIGRRPENAISLSDPKCSRRHCKLSRATNQRWTLRDLNSTNGTFVNERRLTSEHLLADGDVIQVGDVELVFVAIPPTEI
ncbi:MAG: FHA domain-containing protein [Planctomycetia bacterium]|nr:FHA domain-containing protein [Planctomycetia bacterium]